MRCGSGGCQGLRYEYILAGGWRPLCAHSLHALASGREEKSTFSLAFSLPSHPSQLSFCLSSVYISVSVCLSLSLTLSRSPPLPPPTGFSIYPSPARSRSAP